jgi:hypothetical protein
VFPPRRAGGAADRASAGCGTPRAAASRFANELALDSGPGVTWSRNPSRRRRSARACELGLDAAHRQRGPVPVVAADRRTGARGAAGAGGKDAVTSAIRAEPRAPLVGTGTGTRSSTCSSATRCRDSVPLAWT